MNNTNRGNKAFRPIVRCNNCYKVFFEEDIEYTSGEDKEFCPHCGKPGCLMDIDEHEIDDVALENLKCCENFDVLKRELRIEDLINIQNEIMEYETSVEPFIKSTFVIQWYEGMVDIDEFIETYKGGE